LLQLNLSTSDHEIDLTPEEPNEHTAEHLESAGEDEDKEHDSERSKIMKESIEKKEVEEEPPAYDESRDTMEQQTQQSILSPMMQSTRSVTKNTHLTYPPRMMNRNIASSDTSVSSSLYGNDSDGSSMKSALFSPRTGFHNMESVQEDQSFHDTGRKTLASKISGNTSFQYLRSTQSDENNTRHTPIPHTIRRQLPRFNSISTINTYPTQSPPSVTPSYDDSLEHNQIAPIIATPVPFDEPSPKSLKSPFRDRRVLGMLLFSIMIIIVLTISLIFDRDDKVAKPFSSSPVSAPFSPLAGINSDLHVISTSFDGSLGRTGSMFDVIRKTSDVVVVSGIILHVNETDDAMNIDIYTKRATYRDTSKIWTQEASLSFEAKGFGKETYIPLDEPIVLSTSNSVTSFYITLKDNENVQNYGMGEYLGKPAAEDSFLQILEGATVPRIPFQAAAQLPFQAIDEPRRWNGGFVYDLL